MRNFSWMYFTLTGDVESFMLYKEMDQQLAVNESAESSEAADDLALIGIEDHTS